jgi:hypothetical protein
MNGKKKKLSEDDGFIAGLKSGESVPRQSDEIDMITSWHIGGENYQRGFVRGVNQAGKDSKK